MAKKRGKAKRTKRPEPEPDLRSLPANVTLEMLHEERNALLEVLKEGFERLIPGWSKQTVEINSALFNSSERVEGYLTSEMLLMLDTLAAEAKDEYQRLVKSKASADRICRAHIRAASLLMLSGRE